MIEINKVSKSFIKTNEAHKKVKFLADDNISIKINEGEIVGILGPNGAGKTTLLRMIAGIMTPDDGAILIDNMNYKKNSITIKHNIAYLSGNTKLYQDITGRELLTMCGKYYGMKKDEINKQIDTIINKFDLSSFINQKIGKLSTGQLQRINIARCIIHNPKYYILDEATSGLDILSSKVILDFIKEQKELGKGIIYSTHYMEEAENICDIVYLIHKGKIVSVGKPTDIINKTNTTNLRDAFFAIIGDNHE